VTTCDDLLAISNVLAGYAQHTDLAQWDELGALFAEDAVLHVFGRDYQGRAAVIGFLDHRVMGKHILSVPKIEIDGDGAKVSGDYAFYRFPDLVLFGVGVYHDELAKIDGSWKFTRREIAIHAFHSDLTAAVKQTPTP
jgi:hypothetical protein